MFVMKIPNLYLKFLSMMRVQSSKTTFTNGAKEIVFHHKLTFILGVKSRNVLIGLFYIPHSVPHPINGEEINKSSFFCFSSFFLLFVYTFSLLYPHFPSSTRNKEVGRENAGMAHPQSSILVPILFLSISCF